MSSVTDALRSDNFDSDGHIGRSSPRSGGSRTPRAKNSRTAAQPPSSSRVGPPSEANGHMSEDEMLLDPDDEVVGARGGTGRRPLTQTANGVSLVVDQLGETLRKTFEDFLESFVEAGTPPNSTPGSEKYYVSQVHGLRIYNLSTLYVNYAHVASIGEGVLASAITGNYYRFLPFMTKALHNLIAKYEPKYYQEHRQQASGISQEAEEQTGGGLVNQQTDKLFTLAFYNLPAVTRLRHLRTADVGCLLSLSGTVTRTSEVRPELSLATFICEACKAVVPNVEQVFRYTEPTQCPNLNCGNRQGWRLDIRQSTFVDWQKVRVQENSSEIPTGSMPRIMDVILRGEIVDRAKAGEKCIFTGTLIVVPDVSQLGLPGLRPEAVRDNRNAPRGSEVGGSGVSGLKSLGVRDLTYRLAFLACMVTPDVSTAGSSNPISEVNNVIASLTQNATIDPQDNSDHAQETYLKSLTPAEIDDLKKMVHSDHIYSRLVNSIAPMVYGHEIIKKGLLLQLMGGVHKSTAEGMQLRGDINICIVGDPSTSKSQFLKYICSFLPRAVYTSGKASSAAGLTAAVVKDEETGEFTIEAGALMLADNGICAIDEFDKMDIADQVAIHEAMEQQTISIAKAGIQATLNARTSILAAANPVGGRYNRKATLRSNINMSAPIMSRFDLFFVVLDECNESVDRHLAEHIVNIHRLRDEAVEPEFTTEQLQRYIRFARTFRPVFTQPAKDLLVAKYKELRADDAQGGIGRNSYRITVRQLESMIRLSEAIAKANCVEEITPAFVIEAFNLLRQSIISVEKDDVEIDEEEEAEAEQPEEDAMDEEEPQQVAAPRVKISYDRYMAVQNMFIQRVNEEEMTAGEGVEENELIMWYLEEKSEDFENEDALHTEEVLAKKILKRMVKENILLPVHGEGLRASGYGEGEDEDAAESSDAAERTVYVIHPNCAIEEVGAEEDVAPRRPGRPRG